MGVTLELILSESSEKCSLIPWGLLPGLQHLFMCSVKLHFVCKQSEPSIFAKYQSKPQLFGGDEKERGLHNFPAGRFKSALEQFEDKKKKIQEKHDRYVSIFSSCESS